MIDKRFFDNFKGRGCYLYTLRGDGIEVGITDFGAAVQYLKLNTKSGVKDIVLGYPTIAERLESGTFSGSAIGRVANRIKNSRFSLNGEEYNLSANDGAHCNHGGVNGFDKRFFTAETQGDILTLKLISEDGDQGFPGNLDFSVSYEIVGKSLEVRFSARCDKSTVWAPTLHPYFNLDGEDGGSVEGTLLTVNADEITLTDGELICTGERAEVCGTPFDFTSPRPIKFDKVGGFDHNYILKGEFAARAESVKSGVKVDIYTDLPCLQFYSGNFLNGTGKSRGYFPRDGFCLEPQFCPNAVNLSGFEKPVLKKDEKKSYYIKYIFG